MTKLKDLDTDYLPGQDVGLDMYSLEGDVDIYPLPSMEEVIVSLNVYPMYTNFFSEEELNLVDILQIERYYDAEESGTEWENSTLSVYESFSENVTLKDALGFVFDKAQPLIQDLETGKFEDVVKGAMEQ